MGYVHLLVFVLNSCSDDENITPSSLTNSKSSLTSVRSLNNTKSTYTDFDTLGMAANVDDITFGSGEYTMSFYDGTPDHNVQILAFDTSSFIEFNIKEGLNTYNVEIDVSNETIDIQTIGIVSFSNIDDTLEIDNTNSVLNNITAVISVHHMLSPNSGKSFDNNGTSDSFPSAQKRQKRCFWCSKKTYTPCVAGAQNQYKKLRRFWICVGSVFDKAVPC